ncbi:MAG: L-threonylcarbamoyladenylate synthase [Bacteriovoracaceae bacterium]
MKKIDLETAARLLRSGEVVAIPTETVYGLGGWIMSHSGLEKIFSTKERPFFDPLIVHIAGIEDAKKLTPNWTPVHQALAQNCWPGPLTLIADKGDSVDWLITAGLASVGLRCPDHPLALELLKKIEGGVAAPSANKFGKTSPTSAEHVEEEFGDAVAILDGGPCRVGIESTVAGVKGNLVEIYRPGLYTAAMLKDILKDAGLDCEVRYAESPVAPGQLKHHYMPKIPLVIVAPTFDWAKDQIKVENLVGKKLSRPAFWIQPTKSEIASRELYESLRKYDTAGHDVILTKKLPEHSSEEWMGIWNRLEKAKSGSLLK